MSFDPPPRVGGAKHVADLSPIRPIVLEVAKRTRMMLTKHHLTSVLHITHVTRRASPTFHPASIADC